MFTEQEFVQQIEATFDDLAAYGQRLRAPHYSAPGSQLAQDDTDWTPLSISQLAWDASQPRSTTSTWCG